MKRYTVTLIKANGAMSSIEQDLTPDLQQLQNGIGGGLIELIPYFSRYDGRDCVAFVDEEGKIKGLPFNAMATAAWSVVLNERFPRSAGKPMGDYLCGDVIIVAGNKEDLARL